MARDHNYWVYMLTNWNHSVLYIGFTSNLWRRIYEHKHELNDGFTKRYHVHKLVYYAWFSDVHTAIAYEKQLKGWRRERKNALIEEENPYWKDLSDGWYDQMKNFDEEEVAAAKRAWTRDNSGKEAETTEDKDLS